MCFYYICGNEYKSEVKINNFQNPKFDNSTIQCGLTNCVTNDDLSVIRNNVTEMSIKPGFEFTKDPDNSLEISIEGTFTSNKDNATNTENDARQKYTTDEDNLKAPKDTTSVYYCLNKDSNYADFYLGKLMCQYDYDLKSSPDKQYSVGYKITGFNLDVDFSILNFQNVDAGFISQPKYSSVSNYSTFNINGWSNVIIKLTVLKCNPDNNIELSYDNVN